MDEHIFNQLDELERGAHGMERSQKVACYDDSRGYSAFDTPQGLDDQAYGYSDDFGRLQHDFGAMPLRLDPFDERLLRQPDHHSRQGQAALGRARLSLPPSKNPTNAHLDVLASNDDSRTPARADLTTYSHGHDQYSELDVSPEHSVGPSSPAFRTSKGDQSSIFDKDLHVPQVAPHASTQYRQHRIEEASSEQILPGIISTWPAQVTETRDKARLNPHSPNSATPVVQGINLVPTRELPDHFRVIFPFPLFNAVQSKCFSVIYKTNDNFVVSAPTGSGKTAVLELAICRLINNFSSGSFKIVYQAPTKSLCSERQRDWQAKFTHLDLQCAELTGDTDNAYLRNVQHASIIITTPEKWDSMTRKWKDHQKLMQMVKLFLIDEVHILKEDRGATLEAVVSRMKSIGSEVRFVALSATVPNSHDIATWLGKDPMNPQVPAPRERFGEEFRPVRLQKYVCGYKGTSNPNEFAFDRILGGKLTDVIAKWSQRKPLMVFCFTRKSCTETAKLLAQWWSSQGPHDRWWVAPRNRIAVKDKDLKETVASGVAIHHAGISNEDRTTIEKCYLEGDIGVICCTSTLAVGVNLPCHMVIIKGTVIYQNNGGAKEYSDLEIMQMLGRAGRPQFDTSAIAVIMTRLNKKEFYEKMVSGQETLESTLHLNLVDHLNSEIGLGTITSSTTAKKWLTGTFLYVRLKDNPDHYKIAADIADRDIDERLQRICDKAIAALEEHDLVRRTPKLQCTEFGEAMARYYLQFDTMKRLLALPPRAKISEILSVVSQAAEYKDIRFRAGEKPAYKELNNNSSIKFPIPVNIDSPTHKVSLIFQSVLGAIELPEKGDRHRFEYNLNKATVFQHAPRLIRCIIDCQLYLDDSIAARNALMLARSFSAQVWDDSPLHIKQLEGVGLVYVRKLVTAGIKSIEDLGNVEPLRIEAAVSRNPPFGTYLQAKAKAFPRVYLSLKTTGDVIPQKGEGVILKIKAEIGFTNEKIPETFQDKPVYVCFLADTSDGRKAHFIRTSAKKLNNCQDILFRVKLTSPTQTIRGFVMCDEVAGTQQSAVLKPEVPSFMFPAPKTAESTTKPLETIVNAPNTSKRRAEAAAQPRPANHDDDEFGDTEIADTDLAAIVDYDDFVDIDEFDDSGNRKTKPEKTPTSSKYAQLAETREPRKLSNGKWACNHSCKDKVNCRHLCCTEGLEKKPRPSKPKELKKRKATLDPKQTHLDLPKTMKSEPSTSSMASPASIAPVYKTDNSSEGCSLNQVHSSVKSLTRKVPLLKDRFVNIQTVPAASKASSTHSNLSSDYGLNSLNTAELPDELDLSGDKEKRHSVLSADAPDHDTSDEMLDILDEDNIGSPDPDHTNVNMLAQDFDFDIDDFTIPVDDSLMYRKSAEFGEQDMQSPASKCIFVTGESSSSIDPPAADFRQRPTLASKRHLEDSRDPSKFFPPAKKAKCVQEYNENDSKVDDGPMVDGALSTQQLLPQQHDTFENDTESMRDWFYREFGDELFYFTG